MRHVLHTQVVSKKKLNMAAQEDYHERLSEKFDKIERERKNKEATAAHVQNEDTAAGGRILLVTHVNTFLYAACFFIQVGTLPVSSVKYLQKMRHCIFKRIRLVLVRHQQNALVPASQKESRRRVFELWPLWP